MKKKVFVTIAAFAMVFGLSSCSKNCQTCEWGGTKDEVCKDDFDTDQEYEDAIKIIEAFGGNCK